MGKIIVKNIKGMGWKTRIGLIAMFTMMFSVLIYQGLNQQRTVQAAVALGTAWQSVHADAPNAAVSRNGDYTVTSSSGYTAAAGSNRLMLVSVHYELTVAAPAQSVTVTIGGVTVTPIVTTTGTARNQHVWLGYVKDASIPAASSTVTAVYNKPGITGGTTISSVAIKVGTYTGVDQAVPVVGSNANYAAATTVASNAAVSYITGGKTVVTSGNGGVTATPAYTATPALTSNSGGTSTTGQSAYIAESATHVSSSSYPSGGISITYTGTTTAFSALAVASLRPAITTLGNGTAGTNATVAPGAADQKIDGFSLITGSVATTDSITGLTVTTSNQAAIASMKIMNEAGSTQYFNTANNPGTNSWVFSGGTAIPVTSTVSNYKIWVTYKTRAGGAPTGSFDTTAYVSAFTSNNLIAGTDTADTTLTLSNVHAASTWGTCTATDNQVSLNWTYGTPGQSVVVIRYTANSDTTKPTDGTTYATGNAFGTGGTVRYVGAAATLNDSVGVVNGTTYYYKIFEYDTYRNYYNATDVWTAALTPVTSDPNPPVVDPGFTATTPVNSVSIPITSYGASDVGLGVAGYLITTSPTPPAAGAAGWTSTPPGSFTVGGQGSYTLYPWAKDGGGNVSGLYGAPVTVIVDLAKPTVTAFTVASQVASLDIPLGSFTASDTGGSSMAAYMITTTSAPPAFDVAQWQASAPATYTVGADGSYTLYPWAKDAAGNVSLVFSTPRTVLVDTSAPVGLSLVSPADEAVNLPPATTLNCTTATDSGSGGVMYQFQITGDDSYAQNSGWQAGTTYAPPALVKGNQYVWSVKAKDALGNETVFATSRTFSIIAPCVRNNPTLIFLTGGGGVSSTISSFSGTSTYNLRLINNDTGDCGSTTFNLTTEDYDLPDHIDDSLFDNGLTAKSVMLGTNSEVTTPVTVKARPDEDNGVSKTRILLTDPNHDPAPEPAFKSSWVQTTINVVTCVPKVPLLIVGPDSGYLNRAGKMVYTVTVKNTDSGAGCTPVTYNLSLPSESNSTDYNASQLNTTSLILNSGELKSATLTVSAKATATRDAVNLTAIALAASGHTSPANITVKSTVNNPMLHNSDNTSSTKWSVSGGWGIPNGRYGEIDCNTCHVGGGGDTLNIKRVNENIFTPYTTGALPHFPGEGKSISYRRYVGSSSSKPVFGWDAGATPRFNPTTTRICEACHTYDDTGANGSKAHPYSTTATLGNHFNTDGTDCTRCHKHNKGFGGVGSMVCNSCHGDPNVTAEITAANRYVVAPPKSATGKTGVLTGTGQVSNDPKVGAHQTHLLFSNGFSNYSTVNFRCENCHGTLAVRGSPTQFDHADGSSTPVFQGLANNWNARTSSFSSINLTCSNTYCHNPAGTGGTLASANAGLAILPSWSSASYIADGTHKTQSNCNRCHKVPGDAGFSFQGSHSQFTVVGYDCSGCHGHNGDGSGLIGKRHVDGIRYFGGHAFPYRGSMHKDSAGATAPASNCSCHDYTNAGSYPVARGTAPACRSCHTAGILRTVAAVSCYDCHGSGAAATAAWPNGTVFPNNNRSHTKHSTYTAITCDYCHNGFGTGSITHGNYSAVARVQNDTKIAFSATVNGTAAAVWTAGTETCSTTKCHGSAPSPAWGAASGKTGCAVCHGYRSASWNALDGATAATDHRAGVHFSHISSTTYKYRSRYSCLECHSGSIANTTDLITQANHFNNASSAKVEWGTAPATLIATNYGAYVPTYAPTTKGCSNVWCHGANMNSNVSNPPATRIVTPIWKSPFLTATPSTIGNGVNTPGTGNCATCHGFPPMTATHAGQPLSSCNGCHSHVSTSGLTFLDPSKHVNGSIQATSDCISCHTGIRGGRAAVVGHFNYSSHHVQGRAVTNADCYQCHAEAADTAGVRSAQHVGTAGASIDLMVWGTGARGTSYISYTANGKREQIAKLNNHCLSCHSTPNASLAPFVAGSTTDKYSPEARLLSPKAKTSISSRYSSTRVVPWSIYNYSAATGDVSRFGTNQKNRTTKALSAHGNATKNQMPSWSATANGPGEDGNMPDYTYTGNSGKRNVFCYDCHNSHGSDASGITSSYSSHTKKGGLLKSTVAGFGGYNVTYRPGKRTITYANVSGLGQAAVTTTTAVFNSGAGICNDCHNNDTRKVNIARPWSITGTYSSTRAIVGYWSTPYFDNYTFATGKRTAYKLGGTTNKDRKKPMGGHYGSSVSSRSAGHSGEINGLCTPCHDPHGVSNALLADRDHGIPLLKGTWVTSPYREDKADKLVIRGGGRNIANFGLKGAVPGYHIDQNTFMRTPAPVSGGAGTATSRSNLRKQAFRSFSNLSSAMTATGYPNIQAATFAGLCLECHNQGSLTNTSAPSASNWKTPARIHQSVAGWAAATGSNSGNKVHAYTCAKCHAPHVSRLPRLLVTNCLDQRHYGQQIATTISSTANVTVNGGNIIQSTLAVTSAYGAGRFPGGGSRYSNTPSSAQNPGGWWFQTNGAAGTTQPSGTPDVTGTTNATTFYGSACHNSTNSGGATYSPLNQMWNRKSTW